MPRVPGRSAKADVRTNTIPDGYHQDDDISEGNPKEKRMTGLSHRSFSREQANRRFPFLLFWDEEEEKEKEEAAISIIQGEEQREILSKGGRETRSE